MSLRVLIADDHEIVRRGLRSVLESRPGWEVCDEAGDGQDAVEKVARHRPDVVVLDLSMPRLGGLEATRRIRSGGAKTEVLVLTMHDSEQVAREVLDAGARGYLLKSDAGRELIAAVEAVADHRPYFTSRVASMVLDGYLRKGASESVGTAVGRLSGREQEILQLLAEGRSNKEVAAALAISVKTAETHRANIMRKLDLHTLSDLVRYAIRNKIVEA